jgi:hypothetical protein
VTYAALDDHRLQFDRAHGSSIFCRAFERIALFFAGIDGADMPDIPCVDFGVKANTEEHHDEAVFENDRETSWRETSWIDSTERSVV